MGLQHRPALMHVIVFIILDKYFWFLTSGHFDSISFLFLVYLKYQLEWATQIPLRYLLSLEIIKLEARVSKMRPKKEFTNILALSWQVMMCFLKLVKCLHMLCIWSSFWVLAQQKLVGTLCAIFLRHIRNTYFYLWNTGLIMRFSNLLITLFCT